ncbi:MAG TPA: hypothetical protein VMF11_11270 [Candidatus Baltobacteraceae bacterium]|nr:hypothetical protein [Candidatus Baltobacteraceae bacterium]
MEREPTPADLMNAILDMHGAMSQGFAQVDARFGRLEARVTSIEGEIRGIHHWIARSDARFDALERRL